MNLKRLISLFIIVLFALRVSAQQWVLDEIAEEQRESGSDPTAIPGLIFLGIIILCVYLWNQHKKEEQYYQDISNQKKKEKEAEERANKLKKEKESIVIKERGQEKNAIDLGLSVLWADRNLFASCSTDKGEMFAWGDNVIKKEHTYTSTYLYDKSDSVLAKVIGNNKRNICGNKTFDPATNNWGEQWRLPQVSEIKELLWCCKWVWSCRDNVYGYIIIGANGNSIFLPITGTHIGNEQTDLDKGYYWSGIGGSSSSEAKCLRFVEKWHVIEDYVKRWQGCAVRPVWPKPKLTNEEIINTIDNNIKRWEELSANDKYETYKLSYELTKTFPSNDIIDDLDRHACYSEDGKRMESIMTGAGRDERWPSLIPRYGTEIICDQAYNDIRHKFLDSQVLFIPETVYAIGNFAFEFLVCSKIILPKSLKYITGNPFTEKYLKIESNSPYYKVENNALISTNGILFVANMDDTSSIIRISENIEIIGRNAFYANRKLEHLIISKSVNALADLFIQSCDNLRIIEFLGKVQIIDKNSFNGCKTVKTIIVPDEYFDDYQFMLPEDLKRLIRPKSLVIDEEKTIEQIAIEEDKKKVLEMFDESCSYQPTSNDYDLIKKYKGKFKKTIIKQEEWDDVYIDWGEHENEEHEPWENGDAQYSQDRTRLLRHFADTSSYIIKEGTKIICDYAFGDSYSIKKINLPKSITCIGDMMFYNSEIKYFKIPKSIRTITGNPFVKCSLRVTCESSYFIVEKDGLYDKDKQILISIFNGEKYREKIYIDPGIRIIGRNACNGMFLDGEAFIIPDSVIYIADDAFRNTIFDIKMPSKLIEIGNSAFEDSYLKAVKIPDSVQKIGQRAFYGCENLTEISLPKNIICIEKETFACCEKLLKINIPEGCKTIKEMAFWSCYSLVDVYLPDSLKIIEKEAFGNGHLTTVVVSRKTIIKENAFPKECKILYRD